MAVNLKTPEFLHPVAGVRLSVAQAAIKKPGRDDMLLIEFAPGTKVAGVFTRNSFAAAPVQICRRKLASGIEIRALLVNSGNANAATGQRGIDDANAVCCAAAAELGCKEDQILPFSTGVIGQRLPVDRMVAAAKPLAAHLHPDGWHAGMKAIMTTDTVAKGATRRVPTSQGTVTVTGIAKGVGMIHPDMATMLAYIGTDARLSNSAVGSALNRAVNLSFNNVTVDGDTSTNDSCILFATGQIGSENIDERHPDFSAIAAAIDEVSCELAHAIVRDGEGATKFIAVHVHGARSTAEARQVAFSIAHSPLVKTAMFASDANWGRIVMAIGKAGIPDLDATCISLALDDVELMSGGEPSPGYDETKGAAVVARSEFTIHVGLGRGSAEISVWTCDFSYDYVKINAEYRS